MLNATADSNPNPKLTGPFPIETDEKMNLLIPRSLSYYKSVFKELYLANQHNAMLLCIFLQVNYI